MENGVKCYLVCPKRAEANFVPIYIDFNTFSSIITLKLQILRWQVALVMSMIILVKKMGVTGECTCEVSYIYILKRGWPGFTIS